MTTNELTKLNEQDTIICPESGLKVAVSKITRNPKTGDVHSRSLLFRSFLTFPVLVCKGGSSLWPRRIQELRWLPSRGQTPFQSEPEQGVRFSRLGPISIRGDASCNPCTVMVRLVVGYLITPPIEGHFEDGVHILTTALDKWEKL